MDRRAALRNIVIASSASLFLNSCVESDAIEFLQEGKLLLNARHQDYLGVISEAILPVKAVSPLIPAASDFILRMLNDCHSAEDIQTFTIGFDQYKLLMSEHQHKIKAENAEQALLAIESALTEAEPQEEMIFFIDKIKSLSVKNLATSEYYLREKRAYSQIPPPYEACASI